jgi:hypothetical protein
LTGVTVRLGLTEIVERVLRWPFWWPLRLPKWAISPALI